MTVPTIDLVPTLQAASADTVVTVLARDGLQTAADVSLVVLGVFLIILLVVLVVLLLQLRKLNATVRGLGDAALRKADPIVERGKGVADNVEFISSAVRTDVERLNSTVRDLTDRLQQASDRMEVRIEEFNALMEVVQGEAEDIFIDTAATARGVREGVRSLGGDGRRNVVRDRVASRPPDEEAVLLTGGGPGAPAADERERATPAHDETESETSGSAEGGVAARAGAADRTREGP